MRTKTYGTVNPTSISHNGDFSGEVHLAISKEKIEPGVGDAMLVTIEFDSLRALVLEYLRRKAIDALENMDDEQLVSALTLNS